jgi:hypothetical protein
MTRPLSVLLGVLLSTLSAFAAPVHLGPETPLGTQGIGAAASLQASPSAAWNGHTGLVVWTDDRGHYPAEGYNLTSFDQRMLRVSPMHADGSLVNPKGTPLVPALTARIASNGSSNFLLVYSNDNGTFAVALDESGRIVGTPVALTAAYSSDFSIVSNGHTYLFAGVNNNAIEAMVFSESGLPIAFETFTAGPAAATAPAATAIGDHYAIAYRAFPCASLPCDPIIRLAVMSEDAIATDQVLISGTDVSGTLSMAANEDRLLLALINTSGVRTIVAGSDGKAITPLTTVTPKQVYVDRQPPVYWDGQNFLVTWQVPPFGNETLDQFRFEGVRVSSNNNVLDSSPAVIARNAPLDLSFTRTSNGTVAIWYSQSDILRRSFASTGELFTKSEAPTPEVLGVHAQSEVTAVPFGAEPLRVWREGSLDVHVMLAIGAKTIDVAASSDRDLRDPSVARGGNVILVFWRDLLRSPYFSFNGTGYRTYIRRFALDGTPLDPEPLLVANADSEFTDTELGTATAFDGRNFIVLWSGSTSLRAMRISPIGGFIDAAPLFIESPQQLPGNTSVHAIWTGSELLVAWSAWNDYRGILLSPPPPPRTAITAARLDTSGSRMKVIDTRTLWQDSVLSTRIDFAWNGTNALIASIHGGCVEATLIDASLATVQENAGVACNTFFQGVDRPATAWNGSEFVVAWSQKTTGGNAVRATRFDRSLRLLDDAPFAVAPSGVEAFEPVVAASAAGTDVTYVRVDAATEVPRAFTRTLDRIGMIPRGRSVR